METKKKKPIKKFDFATIKKEDKKGIYESDADQPAEPVKKETSKKSGASSKPKKETEKKKPGRKAKNIDDKISENMVGVYFSNNELEQLNKAANDNFLGSLAPSAVIRILLKKHEYI